MPEILFSPFEKVVQTDGSKTLLQLARDAHIPLMSTCGGKKKCGKCAVLIETIENSLPPASQTERAVLGERVAKGYRLACEIRIDGEATVTVPAESRITDPAILTDAADHLVPCRVRPDLSQFHVVVPPPELDPVVADRERLLFALEKAHKVARPSMDPFVLRRLPHALRSDPRGITVILRHKKEIIGFASGKGDSLLGVAFDVGTTTVVAYLMDLTSGKTLSVKASVNPQIAFGADVISRISFCRENPEGLERLRSGILLCLNDLISAAATEIAVDSSQILSATIVGNTAMHHLLVGLDPRYLSMAPYAPVLQESGDMKARDLGLEIGPSAYVHLLPLKAGFVGSDTIACILATGLHRSNVATLLVDLGTNGEIVFGNKHRMLCCSTAAGPAFEGGHIRWGMGAAPGAIDRIKIDAETLEVAFTTIGRTKPIGLCGSGIISAVAEMIRAGILLSLGNFDDALKSDRLREGDDGLEFVLVWASETGADKDIVITQKDVSEIQMAKSAIHAGASLLVEEFEGEGVERILLAGAGGNFMDPRDACAIDLFPECLTGKIEGIGNAAGYGACLALVDHAQRETAERIAEMLEYRELAVDPRFQELFVSGMVFTAARDYDDDF